MIRSFAITCLAATLTVATPIPAATQATPTTQARPTGDELIAASVEATGGAAAWLSITSMTTKITMKIPSQGLEGSGVSLWEAPLESRTVITISGLGDIVSGITNGVVWEETMMMGPRIVEGIEAVQRLREADIASWTHPEKYCKGFVTSGEGTFNGTACWKVAATPIEGLPSTIYFDQETSRVVGMDVTAQTAMGDIPTSVTISRYQSVGGVQIPTLMTTSMMGMQQVIEVSEIELNAAIPSGTFDLPESIKALMPADAPAPEPVPEPIPPKEKQKITSMDQLPARTYPWSGKASTFLEDDSRFASLATPLAVDLRNDLTVYEIVDTQMLEDYLGALLHIAVEGGDHDSARVLITQIRELESKSSKKAIVGIVTLALCDAREASADDPTSFPQEFRARLQGHVGALPWELVQPEIEQQAARARQLTPAFLMGIVQASLDGDLESMTEVDGQMARQLISLRNLYRHQLPVMPHVADVYEAIIREQNAPPATP